MSSSPPAETSEAVFVCDCKKRMRSACQGLPFFKEHEGRRYCVLHYPGEDKEAAFGEALASKLDAADFDFNGVWFPGGADFREVTFTTSASFTQATFRGRANFYGAEFSGQAVFDFARFDKVAEFVGATFGAEASFNDASFGATADFNGAEFGSGAFFVDAEFGAEASFVASDFGALARFDYAEFGAEASFSRATFGEAEFSHATFKDSVRFAGDGLKKVFGDSSYLNLQFARIERPDRFSFHTLRLRPHWFVNVDARKFEFVNVAWSKFDVDKELSGLAGKVNARHRLLAVACRNLADNAEEHHRYEEASMFRYAAMNVRRRERRRGFAPLSLSWWYWLASGYGERAARAFLVLLGVWLLSALLYTQVGFARWEPRLTSEGEAQSASRDAVGRPLEWPRALTYSAGVMTLQRPEPRPATDAAQALVMLETILGPVQAALLALAIRRKFMR